MDGRGSPGADESNGESEDGRSGGESDDGPSNAGGGEESNTDRSSAGASREEATTGDDPAGAKTTRHGERELPGGVGLFVDGPNVLREEFDVDLGVVREAAADAGPLVATRLYVDEHASPGLIKAAEANGFRVVVTSGDVDVRMAVDVARFAAEGRARTVAVASRDTDFKPAVEAANEYGLATLVIAPGTHGRSDALRNAATRGITLDE